MLAMRGVVCDVRALYRGESSGKITIERESAERVHVSAVPAAKPMEDINVVRRFLQQQARGVATFGVPVAIVEITAVSHEVPHPARLHFADRAFELRKCWTMFALK